METRKFKEIAQNYVYWDTLSQPYLNHVDFSKSTVNDIIPMFRQFTNDEPEPLAPKIYEFYGTNFLINKICKAHSNIVPKEYIELYLHYQETLKDMSKKIFSYIFITSFIEASFCESFSQPISNHLSKTLKDFNIFDDDVDYRDYYKAMQTTQGHIIINNLVNQFVPHYLINEDNIKDFRALFIELGFNALNSNFMTVAEMADEVMAGYGMIGFKALSLSDIAEVIQNIFDKGKFNKDYGGAKWKDILTHFKNYISGTINSEIFIDQALSLEHNNGTLFSKHTIFQTSENFNILLTSKDPVPFDERYINFNKLLLNAQNNSSVFVATQVDYSGLLKKYNQNNNKEAFDNINQFNIFKQFLLKENKKFITKFKDIIPQIKEVNLSHMLNHGSYWDKKFKTQYKHSYNRAFTFNAYSFDEIIEKGLDKYHIGGKAHSLAQLKELGINTPNGLVLDTYTCLSFLNNPIKFQQMFTNNLHGLCQIMGTTSDAKMISVRSGAAISMPGMMDTILNVGIDDYTYHPLCKKYGKNVIDNCAIQFMESFLCSYGIKDKIKHEISLNENLLTFKKHLRELNTIINGSNFPLNRSAQLLYCITSVFKSWNSERAIAWRNENNIEHSLGTACILQEMVLGNQNENSMSGVVFSRDCVHGNPGMIGEYIIKAQGEGVVSGTQTPRSIDDLQITHPHIYKELSAIAQKLEDLHSEIKDIEFTVEDNKLYILQHRKAVSTPQATVKLLKNQSKLLTEIDLKLLEHSLDVQTSEKAHIIGKPAQEGILHGIIINSDNDKEKFKKDFKNLVKKSSHTIGWILSTHNTSPEHVPTLLNSDAFITKQGGYTSHAAIIARSLKKPCIVGTGENDLKPGDIVTMNAYTGEIWKGVIPVIYDNTKTYSLARKILDIAKINTSKLDFLHEVEHNHHEAWFENFSNVKIIKKVKKTNELSTIQQAAIAVVNHHKKKAKI